MPCSGLCSSYVGQILDVIDELEMSDEVFVVMSSDHGGHGKGHGEAIDDDLIIPMFLRGPGVKKGHQFADIVGNVDILPTIAHVLGLKPHPRWNGKIMKDAFETL